MAVEHATDAGTTREALYRLLEAEGPTRERLREAVRLGRAHLDVESGYVLRHGDDETDTVTVSVNGDRTPELVTEGSKHAHAYTYCRRTVEEPTPVALSNASDQGWDDDPAYEEYGLECYLGASVFVRGEVYGTVCFVSRAARERSFDDGEKALVEQVARTVGRLLERDRYERELATEQSRGARYREKYRTLLETVPDAAVLADTGTGAIVEVNEGATELVGYDAAKLREMSMTDFYDADDETKYVELFYWFVENEGTRSRFDDGSQVTLTRQDGTVVPVEISANIVEIDGEERLLALFRDISERLEREADLRLFRRVIEEATIGVTIADATAEDLPLVYTNDEFYRMTGYDEEVAIGRNCNFLQGAETDAETTARIGRALDAAEPVETELVNYRRDGTPFWNRLTIAPVHRADGEGVSHYVGFQQDVTARKRREELIGVLNRLLRHNLRNELTVVSGYAGILADRCSGKESAMATQVQESARELTELAEKARSLEDVMSREAPLESYDLADTVRDVVDEFEDRYPAVTFRVETPATAHVVGHRPLRRAIAELVENAAEHGAGPVQVRVARDDAGVVVEVHDAGDGLSELERQVIEQGTETPLKHSLGVGLWLVNWIVTGVGGTVETDVADGTTVTLSFTPAEEMEDCVPARYKRAALNTATDGSG